MFNNYLTVLFIALFTVLASTVPISTSAQDQTEAKSGKKVYEAYLFPNLQNSYFNMIEGHDIFDVENWDKMELQRHTLEVLIFNVAPIIGGCDCEIKLLGYPVDTPHSRSIEQVRNGNEVSHPVTIFTGDSRATNGITLSEPILDPEDFFVGLYTHEDRDEILSLTNLEDIRKLNFAVGRDWEIDNKILDDRGLRKTPVDNWESVVFMLISGRADVIMQPFFSTDDLSFDEVDGTEKFLPIPDVKMSFPQGRAYFVSDNHPDGPEFLEALNRGILALKSQNNLLYRAHIWAGVINPATDNFRLLFEEDQ